jgi:hypothetical protein
MCGVNGSPDVVGRGNGGGTTSHSIHNGEVEGDQPWVLYIWHVDLPQLLRISVLQNIELSMKISNIALE